MPKEPQEKIPSGQQRGVVVMFDVVRAFGFIRPDGAKEGEEKDVFVHERKVEEHKNLHPGQRVSYHLTRTEKGVSLRSTCRPDRCSATGGRRSSGRMRRTP